MEDRNNWIHLIKRVRNEHAVGIFEAERLALADPRWQRWVTYRINSDAQCRKMAQSHMRLRGSDALIGRDGDRLVVKVR